MSSFQVLGETIRPAWAVRCVLHRPRLAGCRPYCWQINSKRVRSLIFVS